MYLRENEELLHRPKDYIIILIIMWKTQFVDGSKFASEDNNNSPLLSEINPNHKIAISTVGNSENAEKKSHPNSMKGKSLQSLAKVNWCK